MSGKPSPKNRVVIASAGSGKTTSLVAVALAATDKRILITTYTNESLRQLYDCFVERNGCVPSHVTIKTWYSLLLQDGVRPYRRTMGDSIPRAESIYFDRVPRFAARIPKTQPTQHYFTKSGLIYRDRMADFVCRADDLSRGAVIRRLARIYDWILVDEFQDVAGFDLDILHKLFASPIRVTGVGDLRQATFSTNNNLRHRQYRGLRIIDWLRKCQHTGELELDEQAHSYRCNQAICDFADKLFPALPRTTSRNTTRTGHDGIVFITPDAVPEYVAAYAPMAMRYSRSTKVTLGLSAINFGASKGRTYCRVLIFPTNPMLKYLQTGNPSDAGDLAKFYVAVTRARHSVAFVVDRIPTAGHWDN